MLSTPPNQSVIAQVQAKLGVYADGSVQLELQFSNDDFVSARTHAATPTRTPPATPPIMASERRTTELPAVTPLSPQ